MHEDLDYEWFGFIVSCKSDIGRDAGDNELRFRRFETPMVFLTKL